MKFEYQKVTREKSKCLRRKFIEAFINKSHELYARIDGVSADEEVTDFEGYTESYLWSCLKSEYKVQADFYSMMNYLGKMEKEKVYAMWDVRPKKVIYPVKVNFYKHPYLDNFRTDDVIEIAPKELCEILLRDQHIDEKCSFIREICDTYLPDDVYIFDETFSWVMAITHEANENHDRCCFGKYSSEQV